MNIEKLKKQLILHEGYRDKTYKDSLGNLTGGVGHLLFGVDKTTFTKVGMPIANYVIERWLDRDIAAAINGAKRLVPKFDELSDIRQRAIVDLVFNLGETKFSKFTNTLKHINNGDWDGAANGLLNSLWAQQVKSRSVNIVNMIRDEVDCIT